MRIGIDARLWGQSVGVGRYIRNLVRNFLLIDKKNEYVLSVTAEDQKKVDLELKNSNFRTVLADIHWHTVEEQVQLPGILNNANLELMHFPYFSVPFFYNKPFIVTVHDLIINRYATGRASTLPYPLYFAKRAGYHAVLGSAVKRSKKIIVPSNSVRDDLLQAYRNVNPDKVTVTYEGGFETNLKLKTKNLKQIGGKYLLRVGNFYPHKNVEGLLFAFRDFVYESPENNNVKLLLVGKKDYFSKRIERQVKDLNISSNIEFLESISDAELYNLYKNAVGTIVPSFMEGFSLTAVEAMSAGSPVLVSDIPVHREICGDAAIYCNPADVNDIAQKINFACSLVESSRKEMIEQGKKQSSKFSWRKMAQQTLEIYNSI